MTYKDLANVIFPNITKTIEDYEKEYPSRNLPEGAKVTRFAPSPTGFMHIGNLMSCTIDYVLAKQSGGVFYLRNEDTDQARTVEGAVDFIFGTLKHYGMDPDEYEYEGKTVGEYGPYIQSERKEIYHAFIKHLIEIGRAYPCFMTKEEDAEIRENQAAAKKRIGIYGRYARSRNIPIEDAIKRIEAGEKFVIRFKSEGDFEEKIVFMEENRGKMEFPENDLDFPIMKSEDLLPTYHFAHLVDDHLMRTTHVVRGEEWMSSVPIHYELFKTFGYEMPKYIHNSLIMKKDGDVIRKISKRKDPEFLLSYYTEKGYPAKAVIEYCMTIANSNYEEWRTANPETPFYEFPFDPKKMSSSGALFDLSKLDNISKNIISKMTKDELYDELFAWARKYDEEFADILEENEDLAKRVLNIEREQEKPRKDYAYYSEVKDKIWYMFAPLWENSDKALEFKTINDKEEISNIVKTYFEEYYDEGDDKDTWFEKVKDLAERFGYAREVKMFKEDPSKYKGHVGDVSTVLRIAITHESMTPDLYELMQILGKDEMQKRIKNL
ncbi:MAG TPA: glutamate--tRNA ligase [Firmicutes bacterium]|nr:glutamate--tRNA ligase [Bacillota bacterium]